MNVFYAGPCVNNWSKGLWPHSYHLLVPSTVAPGKKVFDYQITNMGDELTLATYCHENGHMLCDFPDLYDYGYQSNGSGVYCLMAGGASTEQKHPTLPCAYLRYKAGWATSAPPSFPARPSRPMHPATSSSSTRRARPNISSSRIGCSPGATSGSPIRGWPSGTWTNWRSNNNEQMTKKLHYECSLEQADGQFDLERLRNQGDDKDLFKAGGIDRFADSTTPSSKWWDEKPSGLDVHDVGPAGQVITFMADCP